MRLIVDTHIFLWSVQAQSKLTPRFRLALEQADEVWLSAVSIWEVNVKHGQGKMPLRDDLNALVDDFLSSASDVLPMTRSHALMVLPDPPPTRDPFDRLLLAQCETEGMKLLTVDKRLLGHRLVWQA